MVPLLPQTKPPTATPTAAAKPTTLPSGTVLYQANSSHGLNSIMHGTTGWKMVHSFLQSDLSNNNVLTSSYVPTVPNYAVEVHFQIVSVPQGGGYFVVAAEQVAGKDGYNCYILHNCYLCERGSTIIYTSHQLISLAIGYYKQYDKGRRYTNTNPLF